MNNINIPNFCDCSGCSACSAICPNNAISMEIVNGFFVAKINESKCINCGLCKKICYRFNERNDENKCTIYCLKHRDNEILKKSSSGGASYAIMQLLISRKYVIYGFGYNKNGQKCQMMKATSLDECENFFGSKYFQADVNRNNMIEDILKNKKDEKIAIFGTPCIIAGIKSLLNYKKFTNVIYIDLFCHGISSPLLWQSYIRFATKNISNNYTINFRTKKYGWHYYSNVFKTDIGEYSSINDKYYELFFSQLFLNKACDNCVARKDFKNSDIRIGDAWGFSYDKDRDGVSLVLGNTKKGNLIINDLKKFVVFIKPLSLEEMECFQSIFNNRVVDDKKRRIFLQYLNDNKDFDYIYKKYLNSFSFVDKVFKKIKKIFNLLPFKLKQYLKCKKHKKCIK